MEGLKWPFYAQTLSQVLDVDLIRYIQSGISTRMDKPFTIVEVQNSKCNFIPTIKKDQNWTDFCRFLRFDVNMNNKCNESDQSETLKMFNTVDNNARDFLCWMSLVDFIAPVLFHGRKIAVIMTGQRVYKGTVDIIKDHFNTVMEHEAMINLSEEQRQKAQEYIHKLEQINDQEILTIKEQLESEAKIISDLAEKRHKEDKVEIESKFLQEVDDILQIPDLNKSKTLWKILTTKIFPLLNDFCGFEYSMFLCTDTQNDQLPTLVACAGLEMDENRKKIMFDWKAGELGENYTHTTLNFNWNSRKKLCKAIIGDIPEPSVVIPVLFQNSFKGVIIFGSTKNDRMYPYDWQVYESIFLHRLASTIGLRCLILRQMIEVPEDRSRINRILTQLAHNIKQDLSSISTEAELLQFRKKQCVTHKMMTENDLIKKIDQACNNIIQSSESLHDEMKRTLQSFGKRKDSGSKIKLEINIFSILEKIRNKYNSNALLRNLDLILQDSIKKLPRIIGNPQDIERALSNIVHNAIKYSHPNEKVEINGQYLEGSDWMRISVRDYGTGIVGEDSQLIFLPGYRGSVRGIKEDEEGSGYGLFDALKIVEEHGGTIKFVSYSGSRTETSKPGAGYVTIFHVTLPLGKIT